ncbi:unnamed protein product [Cunninghamella blakesleeana]
MGIIPAEKTNLHEGDHLRYHRPSILMESDSPDPSLINVISLNPSRDYIEHPWKNGHGTTKQIAIYPPNKDFKNDPFFWRLSIHSINEKNCEFSHFPGYKRTTIILPYEESKPTGKKHEQTSIILNHKGEEINTNIKPLFPYTWNGAWATSCKVSHPPITCLQLLIQPDIGKAQFNVEKVGSSLEDEDNETSAGSGGGGKKRILGAFYLIYVVEGYVQVQLDVQHTQHGTLQWLKAGETLLIERDEDSSPTTMFMRASNEHGATDIQGTDATVISIQITETKEIKWKNHHNEAVHPTFINDVPNFIEEKKATKDDQVKEKKIVNEKEEQEKNDILPSRRHSITSGGQRRRSLVPVIDPNLAAILSTNFHDTSATATSVAPDTMISPTTISPGIDNYQDTILIEQLSKAQITPVDEGARRDSLAMLTHMYDPTQLYKPDSIPAIHIHVDMPQPIVRDRLVIEEFKEHSRNTVWIKMVTQGLNEWVRIPVIVLRGSEDGPVVGVTAAVHGNELNGVPCIHRVVSQIDVAKLKGTLVAVPCVNVVGYLKFQREFADGRDLNRQFPGKEDGYASQIYCYHLLQKVLSQFNYMIDLHTASFGRVNSYYVRADMNDPVSALLAKLQKPQIILHNSGQDGTMRSAAAAKNIKSITVEIGNPQLFQDQYVQWSYCGVMRVLGNLGMYSLNQTELAQLADDGPPHTILCSSGFWIYTRTGGILEVYPGVNTIVRKGDLIARMKNMFGTLIDEYFAPCTSVVIGRSSNPVAMTGDRIVHLGVIKKKGETLAKVAKENY